MKRNHIRVWAGAAGVILALTLAGCSGGTTLAGIASKYGLPADPFDGVLLQVVDSSQSPAAKSYPTLAWVLHLSSPSWVNYLRDFLNVTPPGSTTGTGMDNLTVFEDSSGTVAAVGGTWTYPSGSSSVDFGAYKIDYGAIDGTDVDDTVYTKGFTAKGPGSVTNGTYYVSAYGGTSKFADAASFTITLYRDSIGIGLVSGTLPRADNLVFDFYASASSSTLLAELNLDSTDIATLTAGGVTQLIVKPSDIATLYSSKSVGTGTTWNSDYLTIDTIDGATAYPTQLIFAGNVNTTNSYSSNAPTGSAYPVVTTTAVSKTMTAMPGKGIHGFQSAGQGATPYLPWLRQGK